MTDELRRYALQHAVDWWDALKTLSQESGRDIQFPKTYIPGWLEFARTALNATADTPSDGSPTKATDEP